MNSRSSFSWEQNNSYNLFLVFSMTIVCFSTYISIIVDLLFSIFGMHPFKIIQLTSVIYTFIHLIINQYYGLYDNLPMQKIIIIKDLDVTKKISKISILLSIVSLGIYFEVNDDNINSWDEKYGIEFLTKYYGW